MHATKRTSVTQALPLTDECVARWRCAQLTRLDQSSTPEASLRRSLSGQWQVTSHHHHQQEQAHQHGDIWPVICSESWRVLCTAPSRFWVVNRVQAVSAMYQHPITHQGTSRYSLFIPPQKTMSLTWQISPVTSVKTIPIILGVSGTIYNTHTVGSLEEAGLKKQALKGNYSPP